MGNEQDSSQQADEQHAAGSAVSTHGNSGAGAESVLRAMKRLEPKANVPGEHAQTEPSANPD